jgi:response regulator RpfG family c-di-GMP phosphodiesterase
MTKAEALECIRGESGTHFDPGLTDAFVELVHMEV